MKKILFVCISIMALIGWAAPVFAEGEETRVIVYYFHGSIRCPTCHQLEQYAQEAVESGFKDALASGRLEFKAVNVEDKGNEHYGDDYKLYTKSLILSLVKDGKEIKWKNLNKIWEYAGNKQKYLEYVKNEIIAFLEETA